MGKKGKSKSRESQTEIPAAGIIQEDGESNDVNANHGGEKSSQQEQKQKKKSKSASKRRSSLPHLENDSSSSEEETESSLSPLRRSHAKTLSKGGGVSKKNLMMSPGQPIGSGKFKLDEDENESWLWSFKSLVGILLLAGAVIYFLNFFDARNVENRDRNPFFNS
eukprot:TRINITY_DN3073_c0_g1_i1.p1 TRINITY_DN3073_c0_g1~~TRINITY_DN3073_c0_g1_i1.p1  ORF type:complete len:165 (-),score=38.05 TRINITY_DN3073_c0_g1_i1:25-519(-)